MLLKIVLALTCLYFIDGKLPEESLTVPELIRHWGYPAETHEALTEDGYFLTLHRIPYGHKSTFRNDISKQKQRPVFFLQHGLLCSSSNWVTNLPEQSLGFMLADAGYDVWLGNVRGNTYSQKHNKYSNTSDKFWDFSFDEMAKYDLPAMVEFALKTTGQKQLYYVGHSQGTMMAFAGLSENKKLNEQIKTVYALAPVAQLSHASSPLAYLSYLEDELSLLFKIIGLKDFMPSSDIVRKLADAGCGYDSKVCDNLLFLIAGADDKNMNVTRTPVYLTHTPAGTSVKNMLHFCQLVQGSLFKKYDYGILSYFGNLYHYHSFTPPAYDLSKIDTDIALFSGSHDTLADPKDVKWLTGQISSKVIFNKIVKGYNHLDFIWGLSARNKVYKDIIRMTRRSEKYNI